MERSIRQSPAMARPPAKVPALVFLTATLGVFLMGLLMLAAQSKLGGALILLARHALRLAPPGAWVVALLIVVLWLVVLRREWRSS